MMLQFSILPVGDTPHISTAISKALKIVHESGVEYRLTPMGTLLSGEWQEIMDLVKKCHDAVQEDFDRVITSIKIDDVTSDESTFDHKLEAVQNKSGLELNT